MSDYIKDVHRYDVKASPELVDKIVKHLGGALHNKDASLVAMTDPEEVDRVCKDWIEKKLGVTDGKQANAAIKQVAEMMKADRHKQRVTFYYLTAKTLGKLNSL